MRGKTLIRGFFCILFCVMMVCGKLPLAIEEKELYALAEEAPDPSQLYAASAVLMDADNGRVLYGKNPINTFLPEQNGQPSPLFLLAILYYPLIKLYRLIHIYRLS